MKTRVDATAKTGRIRVGEVDYLNMPAEPYDGYPVVLLHGAGSTARDAFASASFYAHATLPGILYHHNIPSISGWMGGDNMGNDLGMTCVESARTVLDAFPGVDASRVHLVGVSMGNELAMRYASLNPTKVASIMSVMPLSDINAVYQANRAGFRATIAAAWGVTYPAALPSQSDLVNTHAPVLVANGTPVRLLYSTADTTVLPAEVTTLAAALGIAPEIVDAVNNHDELTMQSAMNIAENPTHPGGPFWGHYVHYLNQHNP